MDNQGLGPTGQLFCFERGQLTEYGQATVTNRPAVNDRWLYFVDFGDPNLATAFVTTARIGIEQEALADQPLAGTMIEVPLNSPDPLASIAGLVDRVGDRALIGAGIVLSIEQVEAVAGAGGGLIVAPTCARRLSPLRLRAA